VKHLISINDLDRTKAISILDLANGMKAVGREHAKKSSALLGKTVVNLFFEDSTRTRISFELAAKRLSADVVNFAAKGSSVSKGESLKDTVITLEAMGADAFVVRHPHSGAAQAISSSNWSNAAIVNAGDGTHEHPTQALLDALTIRQRLVGDNASGDLSGIRVLIVGDILHSRVARSNALLLRLLGARVAFCGPATLVPSSFKSMVDEIYSDFDEALAGNFDVVMMLRIQNERMSASFVSNVVEYSSLYGLNNHRFSQLIKQPLVLHPGPMNRGLEISSEVADSDHSAIQQQVRNGLLVRMAVLHEILTERGK